jgi:hypothetical protein
MFAGCSIFNDANRAGIDLDLGLDGILSQAMGVHLTFTAAAERKETSSEKGHAPGGRRDRGSL